MKKWYEIVTDSEIIEKWNKVVIACSMGTAKNKVTYKHLKGVQQCSERKKLILDHLDKKALPELLVRL